jgi:hypothetical protein
MNIVNSRKKYIYKFVSFTVYSSTFQLDSVKFLQKLILKSQKNQLILLTCDFSTNFHNILPAFNIFTNYTRIYIFYPNLQILQQ